VGVDPEFDRFVGGVGLGWCGGVHRFEDRGISRGSTTSCHLSVGYATEMLKRAIPICASLGIPKALITCDEYNVGSRKVIESCGGSFEGMAECDDSGIPKRRYRLHTDVAKGNPASSVNGLRTQ
jgi:RimJ/RimL family protein N-acetyltransferase